jgi:hypothetical protein
LAAACRCGNLPPIGSSGVSIFGEVRYHRANTTGTPTSMVPVTFGVRLTGGPARP